MLPEESDREIRARQMMERWRAFNLPRAVEEEKQNRKVRHICSWMIAGSAAYIVLAAIAIACVRKVGIDLSTDFWTTLIALPPSIGLAIGILGVVTHSKNSVMDLNEDYTPKI